MNVTSMSSPLTTTTTSQHNTHPTTKHDRMSIPFTTPPSNHHMDHAHQHARQTWLYVRDNHQHVSVLSFWRTSCAWHKERHSERTAYTCHSCHGQIVSDTASIRFDKQIPFWEQEHGTECNKTSQNEFLIILVMVQNNHNHNHKFYKTAQNKRPTPQNSVHQTKRKTKTKTRGGWSVERARRDAMAWLTRSFCFWLTCSDRGFLHVVSFPLEKIGGTRQAIVVRLIALLYRDKVRRIITRAATFQTRKKMVGKRWEEGPCILVIYTLDR